MMKMMKNNTIAIAFIKFENKKGQGKKRPVLIFKQGENQYRLFKITTKFLNKSVHIRKYYYQIQQWKEAGLNQPSWIDTSRLVEFHKNWHLREVGNLQQIDIQGLDNFLENIQRNYRENH